MTFEIKRLSLKNDKYLRWKKRTIDRGYTPELSFHEYEKITSASICVYCGNPFIHEKDHGRSRTLERLDPLEGYHSGNVIPVCLSCNQAKSALDEFIHNKDIPWETKKFLFKIAGKLYERN